MNRLCLIDDIPNPQVMRALQLVAFDWGYRWPSRYPQHSVRHLTYDRLWLDRETKRVFTEDPVDDAYDYLSAGDGEFMEEYVHRLKEPYAP